MKFSTVANEKIKPCSYPEKGKSYSEIAENLGFSGKVYI